MLTVIRMPRFFKAFFLLNSFMKRILFFSLIVINIGLFSCQKEHSLENSISEMAEGSLQADGSDECLPKSVQGAFIAGTSLTSTNYIQVDVAVDVEGAYSISTDTINGYYFSASGKFSGTGIETVKLIGKGKPLAAGEDFFTVSFDSTFCNIAVMVLPSTAGGPASFSLQTSGSSCMNATVNGDYTKSIALNSTNKINIEVNVTTIGTYTISTTATNGMSFSGSGVFGTTGIQTVTLTGSGTPVNSGAILIPFTVGSVTCSVSVNVAATTTQPPPTSTYFWKFTSGGVTYQGSVDSADAELLTETVNGVTIAAFEFYGETVTGDTSMTLLLGDLSGAISANETYSSSATTSNVLFFSMEDGSGLYDANPGVPGSSMTAKVTSHNTATKIIEGTFSGTAKEASGKTKTITNGQFKVNY